MVELWCSQMAAASIFPPPAVIFQHCVAAELPAAPNPSVTESPPAPPKKCGIDSEDYFYFPELTEIEEC